MSTQNLPPNPCLIAIILVARTSSDPFVVFHYPPKPGEDNTRFKNIFHDNGQESTTSSSDEDNPDSATEGPKIDQPIQENHEKSSPPNDFGSASPEKPSLSKPGHKWNDLFGLQSSVLAKLLSPSMGSHKKKSEVGLNGRVMIGRPVFARLDGSWKKAKKARRSSSRSNLTLEKIKMDREERRAIIAKFPGIEEKDQDTPEFEVSTESHSDAHENTEDTPATHANGETTKADRNSKKAQTLGHDSSPSLITKKSLVMFNVVCVLQAPPLEYHLRVSEIYDNVVKKLSKALKWEQSHSNYVANEVASIASLTKRRETLSLSTLYHDLISQSSFAKAIATLYNSISSLRIAHISLTPSLSLSLQIPLPTSISVLPTPLSPQLPGLWLTTATSMPSDDEAQTTGTQLGSHFTLLLLSDLQSILSDVNAASSPITEPLTHYLRVSTPNKSFYQISQSSGIPLPDIQFLALHLIYWRRARAIPPLHQRDTYIVSPNADMRKLAAAASTFAKVFPTLPSLPYILSTLSSRVRPYSNLIPSKDHKNAYMEILSWLMRGGWVTQLRTFAWVRVPSHVKDIVSKQNVANGSDRPRSGSETDDTDSATDDSEDARDSIYLDVPRTHSRSISPTSSTHTTIVITNGNSTHAPSLIPNPRLASDLPSRHLSAISKLILQCIGTESQSAWDKCVVYFDGKHALETIPVREGWKRKRVKELVDGWVELGVLVRARHW